MATTRRHLCAPVNVTHISNIARTKSVRFISMRRVRFAKIKTSYSIHRGTYASPNICRNCLFLPLRRHLRFPARAKTDRQTYQSSIPGKALRHLVRRSVPQTNTSGFGRGHTHCTRSSGVYRIEIIKQTNRSH